MKRWKKVGIGILAGFLLVCIGIAVVLYTQPDITSQVTRIAFASGEGYPRANNYEEARSFIQIEQEQPYPSAYVNNTLDLYYPKDTTATYPVLLWVHGGAFVGGDKRDASDYFTMIASQGYVVIAMNYALAPDATFPIPLRQMEEVVHFMQDNSSHYPMNLDSIFLGGDSAGAHIAGMYVTAIENSTYAKQLSLTPYLTPQQLKGFLSFCGLLDITAYDETDSALSNFLFTQSARSYFDTWNWKESEQAKLASFQNFIQAFPPTYVTDGNTNSFLPQALQFQAKLTQLNIPVTTTFFDESLAHEYQFIMNTPYAQQNFDHVIQFLTANQD